MAARSSATGSTPRASMRASSKKLANRSPMRCSSDPAAAVPAADASAASRSSSPTWASASRARSMKPPTLGRSRGISAVASHRPFTWPNRSSWTRIDASRCSSSSSVPGRRSSFRSPCCSDCGRFTPTTWSATGRRLPGAPGTPPTSWRVGHPDHSRWLGVAVGSDTSRWGTRAAGSHVGGSMDVLVSTRTWRRLPRCCSLLSHRSVVAVTSAGAATCSDWSQSRGGAGHRGFNAGETTLAKGNVAKLQADVLRGRRHRPDRGRGRRRSAVHRHDPGRRPEHRDPRVRRQDGRQAVGPLVRRPERDRAGRGRRPRLHAARREAPGPRRGIGQRGVGQPVPACTGGPLTVDSDRDHRAGARVHEFRVGAASSGPATATRSARAASATPTASASPRRRCATASPTSSRTTPRRARQRRPRRRRGKGSAFIGANPVAAGRPRATG